MIDLPSNSHKSKENANKGIESEIVMHKEIESRGKITKGVGVKKEKGMLETVVKDYIQQDVGGAVNNAIENVVKPGLKNVLFNVIVETARQLLSDKSYGQPLYYNQQQPYRSSLSQYQNQYQQSQKVGGVTYANANNRIVNSNSNDPNGDSRLIRSFDSKNFEFRDKDGIPTARIDAEKTLECLKGDIKNVGYASVASFLRNGGFSEYSHYGYRNIGWTDLSEARVRATLTGYILDLPTPISVRNR